MRLAFILVVLAMIVVAVALVTIAYRYGMRAPVSETERYVQMVNEVHRLRQEAQEAEFYESDLGKAHQLRDRANALWEKAHVR